ncbi:hypothetical protein OH807_31250 [Kitasatospora sp. NBC_01560]|uniref:hypothetical protein n=1 Tax=Kitasatospora sp. NBC_01560 TaxID=2975965 RepID=UPI003869515E
MSAPGTAVPDSTVDQIVFRWQGNLGRRGSGIAAAAWSCPPERADELARELAPLLRVDGALRPSLVRTVTKRGEAAVIRRWPTADPGGRPNTACHLLLGPQEVLGARLSLALRDWSFGTKRFAEEATDRCPPVSRALLRDSAEQTWADTPARIAGVTDALTVATAALLRRPRHRLSLRSDALPGWPERNPSAAVISGLHEIFGHTWLQQPWTFATYDVTDRHDLLVTWVADWATDSGQQQPRSRVDPRRPEADRAHELAARLVERCLETTDRRAAGLPELTGELRDAANWPAEERLRRLARTLGIRAADPRPKHTRPDPDPDPTPDPDPFPVPDPTPLPVPVPAPFPVPDPGPFPVPDPVPDPTPDLDDQPVYAPPERLAPPALPPTEKLRRALLRPGSTNDLLPYLLRLADGIGDRGLLDILREEDLPDPATRRLLLVLHRRSPQRHPEDEHRLCAEVLDQRLYIYRTDRDRPDPTAESTTELARRAAWLFQWAVTPHVRDRRHAPALDALLNALLHEGTTVEPELLRCLVPPPGAKTAPPDLPPELWQRLLHELPPGTLTPPTDPPRPSAPPDLPPPDRRPAPPPVPSPPRWTPPTPPDQQARNIVILCTALAALGVVLVAAVYLIL